MQVTQRKVDAQAERQIIIGMIVSDRFLRDIQNIYDPELMTVPFARTVAGWCLQYWGHYEKAPGRDVQKIYRNEKRKGLAEDQADLIEDFLQSLSEEYEHAEMFNAEYALDQAEQKFKERSLQLLSDDIGALLVKGESREAEALLSSYKRVERPKGVGIDPLADEEAVRQALEYREEDILFRLPGTLGWFLGPVERDTFTAIMAPEKRGKSWWLDELAMRALRARCNVAVFDMGDMSQRQRVRRIATYTTRCNPKRPDGWKVKVPILDCLHNQRDTCTKEERTCDFGVQSFVEGEWIKKEYQEEPEYVVCTACQKNNWKEYKGEVWYEQYVMKSTGWREAIEKGRQTLRRARGARLKLSCHPNRTMNVKNVEALLDYWEQQEGFVPDVIIIDYADIMMPEDSRREFRHQENERWQALRALSQKRHCAVITATQADGASYSQESLKEKNYSEDKRKYSHITAIWTLNQTPREKDQGVMRIGKMFVREDDFDVRKHVRVLQCFDIGRAYLGSFL